MCVLREHVFGGFVGERILPPIYYSVCTATYLALHCYQFNAPLESSATLLVSSSFHRNRGKAGRSNHIFLVSRGHKGLMAWYVWIKKEGSGEERKFFARDIEREVSSFRSSLSSS